MYIAPMVQLVGLRAIQRFLLRYKVKGKKMNELRAKIASEQMAAIIGIYGSTGENMVKMAVGGLAEVVEVYTIRDVCYAGADRLKD
jgi:hypothetical protein